MIEQAAQIIEKGCSLYTAIQQAAQYLQDNGIEEAQTDAWLLLEYVTGMSRAIFLAERMQPMKEADRIRYEALVDRRAAHIPLQHLTGEQEFMGLSFRVNEHVLIPRQDTEILVEEALRRMRSGMRVLDLCTGSGCIAISLVKLTERDGVQQISADAVDLSEEALQVAAENGTRLETQIDWIHSDLFEAVENRYDMIVSNPPYIRTDVIAGLSEEVRDHEPFQALDGKEDGLFFYRKIIADSRRYLNEGGWLLFEIGYDQGTDVSQLMEQAGYTEIEIVKDLAGLDRVVLGRCI